MHNLTYREKQLIGYRWGFIDGIIKTYEETAKKFNVTRERVRQIEISVLKKMSANLLLMFTEAQNAS